MDSISNIGINDFIYGNILLYICNMEYSEALKQKELILKQIEELGKQMSSIQHIIDEFNDTIKNINNFVNKFVILKSNHHYMYVMEVKLDKNECFFKGILLTKDISYQIIDFVPKVYNLPISELHKVQEISVDDFISEAILGINRLSKILRNVYSNDQGKSYTNR